MGVLAALLLSSQHSLQLILGAMVPPEGALLQPVALLGNGDGVELWSPCRKLIGPAHFAAVSTGGLDILNKS